MLAVLLPMSVPIILWSETILNSFLMSYVGRYILSLHAIWFVNSAAHLFGDRPYRPQIVPVENPWVSWIAVGEGECGEVT